MDGDFSADYGLPSIYCRLNDTRFYVETEHMISQLQSNSSLTELSLPIRVAGAGIRINRHEEPIIWIDVTCEDNSYARRLKPVFNRNAPLFIRVRVLKPGGLESLSKAGAEWFDQDQFVFTVDEDKTGKLGTLASTISEAAEKLDLKVVYKIDGPERAQECLNVNDKGELYVVKPFDFERGDKMFNFTVDAQISDLKNPSKVNSQSTFQFNLFFFINFRFVNKIIIISCIIYSDYFIYSC